MDGLHLAAPKPGGQRRKLCFYSTVFTADNLNATFTRRTLRGRCWQMVTSLITEPSVGPALLGGAGGWREQTPCRGSCLLHETEPQPLGAIPRTMSNISCPTKNFRGLLQLTPQTRHRSGPARTHPGEGGKSPDSILEGASSGAPCGQTGAVVGVSASSLVTALTGLHSL